MTIGDFVYSVEAGQVSVLIYDLYAEEFLWNGSIFNVLHSGYLDVRVASFELEVVGTESKGIMVTFNIWSNENDMGENRDDD